MVKVLALALLLAACPFAARACPPDFRPRPTDCQGWDYGFQKGVSELIVHLETQLGQFGARLQAMQDAQDRHERLLGFMFLTPLKVTPGLPGMSATATW